MMQQSDFKIEAIFWSGDQRWRCTDIGTRIIVAIKLDHDDDPSWYNGPPYAVAEVVFDEYDMESCSLESGSDLEHQTPTAESPHGLPTEADWDSPDDKAQQIAQARALRDAARTGGLRFNAYLPPRLADWLLAQIESGSFRDPSEAVFVILGEQRDLEPHADLRQESFKRSIQAAIDDPRPSIPAEEVLAHLRKLGREAEARTGPMAEETMTSALILASL